VSENTSIEWAHATFNPWSGCAKVSPGCANCYAANLPPSMRRGAGWGEGRPRIIASDAYWAQPHAWNRKAAKEGKRMRVFCASTADVFEARDDLDVHRERLFNLIIETPWLDWQLLTKRPEHAVKWWLAREDDARANGAEAWWPPNAWIGTSVENQEQAEARIPHLVQIPAEVRFLSCEPLLGPVSLLVAAFNGSDSFSALYGIHWVIVGGESGRGANIRPMHPRWVRDIRDDCKQAGVPFLFKQWGEFGHSGQVIMGEETGKLVFREFTSERHWIGKSHWLDKGDACLDAAGARLLNGGDFHRAAYPVTILSRIGKHNAGRLLDGVTHDGFPTP